MPRSGLMFDKKDKHLTKRILTFFEKVRFSYLSAKEDPAEYGSKWRETVKSIQKQFDSLNDFARELKKYIDEKLPFEKESMNPESVQAEKLYKAIKEMRFKSDEVSDPFGKQIGNDKVVDALLENDSLFISFIHYALRSHSNTLPDKVLDEHGFKPDEITMGVPGLDLEPKDIPLYISEHYGDDKDTKRLKSKFKVLYRDLKELFNEKYGGEDWKNLVQLDVAKAEKSEDEKLGFLIPNKPMYRIFEIDDMKSLKGLSGEFIVQEKYDGMRIQIHKIKDKIKIYSFNEKDITDKCPKQVEAMKNKAFQNCILDAELLLFKDGEPLHRADTVKHVFKKGTDGDLRAHVFDIMKHDDKSIIEDTLRERINILFYQYAEHSSEDLAFPSKKDTRIADSIDEVEEYSQAIMELPASEGVVIKDIESTYYRGVKKNPKWIKWKKFVDLDVIVLDKSKTGNNLHSYTMGIGPLMEEDAEGMNTVVLEGEEYLVVGKALNTKKSVQVGSIIRVKVDEVKKKKDGYSLYSAKLIEIPEVELPDKIETLEQLSKKTKKSLALVTELPELAEDVGRAFKVRSGLKNRKEEKKSFYITDNIHGEAEIILKSNYEGYTIYGFEGDKLMQKNALHNLEVWKNQLDEMLEKATEDFRVGVIDYIRRKGNKPMHFNEILDWVKINLEEPFKDLFESNDNELLKFLQSQDKHGLVFDGKNMTFKTDEGIIIKEETDEGTFILKKREDGNLDFIIKLGDSTNAWTIRLEKSADIYDLFGKSGKYPAIVAKTTGDGVTIDEGDLKFGMQKEGYHEYRLDGDKFKTRMHFRVIPVNEKRTWLAWTGKKQDMLTNKGDEELRDITKDRFAILPFPE